jgi:transcriptional regulator with GAF, ATPase, and Fis domain
MTVRRCRRVLDCVQSRDGGSARVYYRARHASGTWCRITAAVTNSLHDPTVARIFVYGQDRPEEVEAQGRMEATRERWQALQAVIDGALAQQDLDALLRHVLDRLTAAFGVDSVAILLIADQTQELELYLARGPEEAVSGQVRVPLGRGIAGRIAASAEPLIVDDMAQAEPVNPFLHEQIRSLMGMPMRVRQRVIGSHWIMAASHMSTPPRRPSWRVRWRN